MAKTVRETIKELTRNHLLAGSKCYGQCLTAVGWVGGTLPEFYEKDGMVELSMADVAGAGIVVGAALAGERPIYVVRYQGFQWFNAPIIANYAMKSKDIWKRPCPMLIRSIAMEGGIGPVAGSYHHSIYHRMPGVKIISPMTAKEYTMAYENFMSDDDVYYISEHRKSYDNNLELENIIHDNADITLFPISITRFAAMQAATELNEAGYKINVIHQVWIKPFVFYEQWNTALKNSKFGGLVLDDDYAEGVASSIAHTMMLESNSRVETLCLQNKTAGFYPSVDNLPPNKEQIKKKILSIMKQYGSRRK